jgi:AbrB family looped-hinge helix DNA binding protein
MGAQQEATMTSKGQVTVPKRVRDALGLRTGVKVVFIIEEGEAVIRAKPKDALERMKELRKHIHFTERELREMIRESKTAWGD